MVLYHTLCVDRGTKSKYGFLEKEGLCRDFIERYSVRRDNINPVIQGGGHYLYRIPFSFMIVLDYTTFSGLQLTT